MKRIFTITIALLLTIIIYAQSPEKMSYQAVVRNANNELVKNNEVGMQISILQGTANGTPVYTETQTPTANGNGLVSIKIGEGTTTDDFASIDWTSGPYFIKTETDPAGGTNYTITGTNQLLSVPYALHAKTAETVSGTIDESDPVFTDWDKSTGILITESQISNLGSYIETEIDPEFSNSQAANITATDIENFGNLSGVNTGDQDLSTLATKTALGDSTAQVRSEIPDVSGIATNQQAIIDTAASVRADIPDVSGIATNTQAIQDTAAQIRADLTPVHYVGELYGGGIVFWVDHTGEHGLIVSLDDISNSARWGQYGTITNATSTWDGATNSTTIATGATAGDAVLLAQAHNGGGNSDWYLPAIDELNMLYNVRFEVNKTLSTATGGVEIGPNYYWSSGEYDNNNAWFYRFYNGYAYYNAKNNSCWVRAVRAF